MCGKFVAVERAFTADETYCPTLFMHSNCALKYDPAELRILYKLALKRAIEGSDLLR